MTLHTAIPRLEMGDRLDRAEFHRRYEAMPQIKKAELLEGVVYVPSPASVGHTWRHAAVLGWLSQFAASATSAEVHAEATVILDDQNEVQPDALVRVAGSSGTSDVSRDGYITGPPELIVEVALSSASYDMHVKRDVYARSGVQEYIVWRVADGAIDWWELEAGDRGDRRYVDLDPDPDGLTRSRVLPGLALDRDAMVRDDMARVLAAQRAEVD